MKKMDIPIHGKIWSNMSPEKKNIHIIQFIVLKQSETIDGYETTYSVEKMKDEDVYPFDENGQLVITNTAIDKQAPNVSVKGEGNGDRFRKITGIAVHDTEGVKGTQKSIIQSQSSTAKYKYLTDIEKLGVKKEGENTAVVTNNAGNAKSVTFYYDTTAPTFNWIVDNKTQAQSKEVRLETSEEIQLPDEGWTEMFTKPEWVSDNSGTATFKVDKWGLEHGLDGYQPFTSRHLVNIKFASMHTMQLETTAVLMFM